VRLATDDALVVEPSRGGDLFPHLHRALHRRDCLGTFRLERRGGAWDGLAEALAGGRPAPLLGAGANAAPR